MRPLAAAALAVTVLAAPGTAQETADRVVAITIDDLPFVGSPDLAEAVRATDSIVAALERHEVPAAGFVTGERVVVEGQVLERMDLLRRWVEAGATLENHSFSHRSLHRIGVEAYLADVVRGGLVARGIMAEYGGTATFHRHPFNHTGDTPAKKARVEAYLARIGYRIAPFTIEHADYVFDRLYRAALARGDSAEARRVGRAYLEQLDRAVGFAESLAHDTFERPIPHVLLIHANAINADWFHETLARLRERGYRFVPLARAVADPAYATPDAYAGPAGISWLHRWRVGLGLPDRLRDEPDPPAWALDRYRELAGGP